jgi:hypothetical protein
MGKPIAQGADVCQHLSFGANREDLSKKVKVANRTREIRPSGMTRGAYGNVMYGLTTICHEAGNGGYQGSC